MEDRSAFTIALECNHQPTGDDSTCWACTVKMFNHDAEEIRRAESAEARVAQLEAERDEARNKLSYSQLHHVDIVMALYEIDNDVFGPLTCEGGIAELLRQRDEAQRKLEQARKDSEHWFRLYKSGQDALNAVIEHQTALNNSYGRPISHSKTIALARSGLNVTDTAETPLGQALDDVGDGVES